ncbi:hypothetical protein CFP71_28110 [Amycolatopsis thailandensis]|uniref:Uncharacterized protein n=1 Tax=Amycolatopsis thailandensis TaxID=589330 RepID=A0A229RUE6_9PSEU|nr:hypothetical protein [Amycolatopsis thailandensis]OXM50298.1 hypothetical protein CFP71_28110 [Amycolatopsis thailandensis]
MSHPTAALPAPTVLVVQRGMRFAVGGHSCDTWNPDVGGYQCDHGFVMWRTQVHESFQAASGQDVPR